VIAALEENERRASVGQCSPAPRLPDSSVLQANIANLSLLRALENPFTDPDLLVERLVPWEVQEKGLLWKLAREIAESFVSKSKSLKDLVRRLRIAEKREGHQVRHEALQFVRIRAEALHAVFPS
jgi:hypothetical protein